MKRYPVNAGYMGYIPDVGYRLFSTEEDYKEFYEENYLETN